jgi:hypothetical protein
MRLLHWLSDHAQEYEVIIVHGIWQFHSLATWLALRASAFHISCSRMACSIRGSSTAIRSSI